MQNQPYKGLLSSWSEILGLEPLTESRAWLPGARGGGKGARAKETKNL